MVESLLCGACRPLRPRLLQRLSRRAAVRAAHAKGRQLEAVPPASISAAETSDFCA